MRKPLWLAALLLIAPMALPLSAVAESSSSDAQTRAIAADAYLYGYPVVEMYKTLYAQAVARGGPNFRAPFNQIGNSANVFTPKDTAIIRPGMMPARNNLPIEVSVRIP